jgi:opacity protein-like surface antigen
MRKINRLISIAAICACSLTAVAETHYKPHISIGGRAGVGMSKMSFSPSAKQAWQMGPDVHFTFRYSEEKAFGIIAELGITQRGWKEDFEDSPLNYSRALTYADLPILTHIYFGSSRFKTFINMGPVFSYMVGSSISADFDYKNPTSVADFPTKSRMTEQMSMDVANKFDYGIAAGLGFEFYVQPKHSVVVECRYYYGLGNIFKATKADTFSASRNQTLELTLGYNFRVQ